jgi:hypothetical protein
MSRVYRGNSNTLFEQKQLVKEPIPCVQCLPRFGVGSRSWAGKENLTEAMSATPMNLHSWNQPQSPVILECLGVSPNTFGKGDAPDRVLCRERTRRSDDAASMG